MMLNTDKLVHNISELVAPVGPTPFEGHERLRLDDYQVCKLIGPYILAAMDWVERANMLVRRCVISRGHVRAYYPIPENGNIIPEYTEIPLPKGVYERAVDLSHGPFSPFEMSGPSEDAKLFLGRLHQAAFSNGRQQKTPKHIVLNAMSFAIILKWLGTTRFYSSTVRDELAIGLMGVLWEREYDQGPSVKVWISRTVPVGHVWTAYHTPPPNWDPKKLQTYDFSNIYPE